MSRRTLVEIPLSPSAQTDNPLDVKPIQQSQTNWCWATCAQMVEAYYGTELEQCAIVNKALGSAQDCCKTPGGSACNVTLPDGQITELWATLGLRPAYVATYVALSALDAEITAGRPVECGLSWTAGGGHVILVIGTDTSGQTVTVIDPGDGTTANMTYAHLRSAYGLGTWDATWTNLALAKENATMVPKTFPLADADRAQLAKAIGARLGHLPGLTLGAHRALGLGEALARYALPLNLVDETPSWPARLGEMAVDVGSLHHQLVGDGAAVGFAHTSLPAAGSPIQVFAIAQGPLGERVEAGLAWLEENAHRDGVVRLLTVPALHVHALWIAGADRDDVLVVMQPPGSRLPTDRLLSAPELVRALVPLRSKEPGGRG